MNLRTTLIWISVAWAALAGAALGAAQAPVAVSPGGDDVVSTASHCPTFNWGSLPGAQSYELVVYRVRDVGDDVEPVLTRDIPATAFGWTPSLDECLEAGEQYGWSIRARTEEGESEWAAPLFFAPAPTPVPGDLAAALEIVRRHLPSLQGSQPEAPLRRELDDVTPDPEGPEAIVAAAAGSPEAKLMITGEVRTLDPDGDPRLWGKGRGVVTGEIIHPKASGVFCANILGGYQYGLTRSSVDWGSAADACPAGTWICDSSEVGECDTRRPDGGQDGLDCAGGSLNFLANDHHGWTKRGFDDVLGVAASEDGTNANMHNCRSLPVWCCWPGGGAE